MNTPKDTESPPAPTTTGDKLDCPAPAGSISDEVAKLEKKYLDALGLLHSVIMSVAINRQKGSLTTHSVVDGRRLDGMIASWQTRLRELQSNNDYSQ